MVDVPHSLAVVNWVRALNHLSVDPGVAALPCQTRCPVCREVGLNLYQDNILNGYWHWCSCCPTRGGMVEMVAEAARISISEAADQLFAAGAVEGSDTSPELAAYEMFMADRRTRLESVFAKAS